MMDRKSFLKGSATGAAGVFGLGAISPRALLPAWSDSGEEFARDTNSYAVFAKAIKAVRENAYLAHLINTDFDEVPTKPGALLSVPVPVKGDRKIPVLLNQQKQSAICITEAERDNGWGDDLQINEAIRSLMGAVDCDILDQYQMVYGFAGTPSDLPLMEGRKVLNDQLVPQEGRIALLDIEAENNLLNHPIFREDVYRLQRVNERGFGTVLGLDLHMELNMPRHVAGDAEGWRFSYILDDMLSPNMLMQTHFRGTGHFKRGDIFRVGHDRRTHVVNNAYPGGVIDFSPAPHRRWKPLEAIHAMGSHRVSLLFHGDAFTLATRPLPNAKNRIQGHDEISGVGLTMDTLPLTNGATQYKFTIRYGVGCVPELACRMAG